MYIISGCLIGQNVRYDGGNSETQWIKEFAKTHKCYACCPEILGGQPCPRPPAERQGNMIINTQGEDVTKSFVEGAKKTWEAACRLSMEYDEPIEGAILKANSPSCGRDKIYDGTFSKKLIEGSGELAKLLKSKGIPIITEKEKIDD